jgi:SAM-dependent methyltransferase
MAKLNDDDKLSELYKIRFADEELERKNSIWRVICRDFLQSFISENHTVLDIACGYGEFINNISAKHKIAVDLNKDAQNFLGKDIEFHKVSATEVSSHLKNEVDIVFTSNFLEHLPNKELLNLFLSEVRNVLKDNGRYLILGPNLRYLPGQYWDFYDHHLGLTHISLSEALNLNGFKIVYSVPRFLPYTTQGVLPTHPILVKLYIHMPFIWPIFGKQFFIIAQKR